eukprot:SAG31_NODE_39142_length_290_cov_1.303665_1_plen_96_part_11
MLRWGPAELAACGALVRLAGNTLAAGSSNMWDAAGPRTPSLRGVMAAAGGVLMWASAVCGRRRAGFVAWHQGSWRIWCFVAGQAAIHGAGGTMALQ